MFDFVVFWYAGCIHGAVNDGVEVLNPLLVEEHGVVEFYTHANGRSTCLAIDCQQLIFFAACKLLLTGRKLECPSPGRNQA